MYDYVIDTRQDCSSVENIVVERSASKTFRGREGTRPREAQTTTSEVSSGTVHSAVIAGAYRYDYYDSPLRPRERYVNGD